MRLPAAGALLVCALFAARPAAALDLRIKDVRSATSTVVATLDLRDLVPDRFRKLIDDGGVLHLRVQTEVWERRPVWDRLVYPAVVRLFRLARSRTSSEMTLTDQEGVRTAYPALPNPLPVAIPVGAADRLRAELRYYVRATATLGTIAEREIDSAGEAVFGRPEEANGLGALGRTVFRRMLQLSDYLQSVTAEATSGNISGRQLLGR
jgi:hypothetical protein